MSRRKTNAQFISEAVSIHGNYYDYSLVDYHSSNTKVTIVCPEHGEFSIRPGDHLHSEQGCRQCGYESNRTTTEEFVNRSKKKHGDRYDYSLVEYVHNKLPVIITCTTHGPFTQKPNDHLYGANCPGCASNSIHTADMFIEKAQRIHGTMYDYSDVDYQGVARSVIIQCARHGPFSQTPDAHVNQQQGCPRCKVNNFSKQAIDWLEYTARRDGINIRHALNGGEFIIPGTPYKVDGFCELTNTVYEFWGDFWHGNPARYNLSDINKVKQQTFGQLYAETQHKIQTIHQHGYRLVDIWESDWHQLQRNIKNGK